MEEIHETKIRPKMINRGYCPQLGEVLEFGFHQGAIFLYNPAVDMWRIVRWRSVRHIDIHTLGRWYGECTVEIEFRFDTGYEIPPGILASLVNNRIEIVGCLMQTVLQWVRPCVRRSELVQSFLTYEETERVPEHRVRRVVPHYANLEHRYDLLVTMLEYLRLLLPDLLVALGRT